MDGRTVGTSWYGTVRGTEFGTELLLVRHVIRICGTRFYLLQYVVRIIGTECDTDFGTGSNLERY